MILTQLCISGMDIYREFKSLFAPDEWEEERELLYSSMKYQHMLPEYFVEEKLYDRLASYVFTNKNEYLIEEYEKYLADVPRGLPQNGRGQGENRTFLI